MKDTKKDETTNMHEENYLAKFMPDDAFSLKVLQDRASILAQEADADDTDEASITNYIKFGLGQNESYGIPYRDVLDVRPAENITKVPMSPAYVAGISYWHGKLITIIDLAKYFNIVSNSSNEGQKIIAAIANDKCIIGLAFDTVAGVDSYINNTLDENLAVNQRIKDSFIYGIHAGRTTIINSKNLLNDISAELMSKKGSHHE